MKMRWAFLANFLSAACWDSTPPRRPKPTKIKVGILLRLAGN